MFHIDGARTWGLVPKEVGMSWYLESLADYGAHRGTVVRGRVHAVCGVAFEPLRAGRQCALERGEVEAAQLCPECVRHGG